MELLKFTLIIVTISLISSSYSIKFPDHDPKDDRMINPTFDPRDKPACGLFKQTPTNEERVWNGNDSFVSQFPWTVCFQQPFGSYTIDYTDGSKPTEEVPQIHLKPDLNIWNYGPYEFSKNKASVVLFQIRGWQQICTGSIVDEHWIITAAHCFTQFWEATHFAINAGTTECRNHNGGKLKHVVVSRLHPKFKTIFEHPTWLSSGSMLNAKSQYDFALVRINDGYKLPVDTYNNEAINRVCIYSYSDLPRDGCLPNVYFSGFGLKRDPGSSTAPSIVDPKTKLTWFKLSKVNSMFCEQHSGIRNVQDENIYCYSSFNWAGNMETSQPISSGSTTNEEEAKNAPNTCQGDSGGPSTYFMRFDDSSKIQTGYRGLLLGTLRGSQGRLPRRSECENHYYWDYDTFYGIFYLPWRTIYAKPLHFGPILRDIIQSSFWNETMVYGHTGEVPMTGSSIPFPWDDIRHKNKG